MFPAIIEGLSFGEQALMVLDETVLLDEIVLAKEVIRSIYLMF